LPTIVRDLNSGDSYVWISNAYMLTMAAFQPLYGQTANIFGRRSLTILSVVLFAIGSAVAGAAKNTGALIAGRTIQGLGGGGINVLIDIIVCDLVPLRQRPKYMGIIFSLFAVCISLGPVIDGLMTQRVTWRWIFYLNLPICGAALLLLIPFLHVNYKKDSIRNMFRRVDLLGNALLIASVVAILLALTWGGIKHPWASWRTLLPLILGILGLAGFLALESSTLLPTDEPTMPLRLFANRTSLGSFGLTFIHAMLTYWITYFLPVYFQSVKEASPIRSGVDLLPTAVSGIPFAILAGSGLSLLNRYRPFHFAGFALLILSSGLFTLLDADSSTATWAGFQILGAAGVGALQTTTLPALQAPLAEADVAVATATWAFLRSLGGIWGVAIPAAVFNSQINNLIPSRLRGDPSLQARLANGGAYELATKEFMTSLNDSPRVKTAVVGVYVDSLRIVWYVGLAFAILGFLVAFVVKEVPMREHLETEFGLDKEKKREIEEGSD
ncbi:multidrug resistance protein Fnx1, partial [Aspergillus steynii IBT 23096]